MLAKKTIQVADNPKLLELMMADLKSAPEIFKPTNYWAVYEKKFLPELQKLGLRDFRKRQRSVLKSFGATDILPLRINLFNQRILLNKFSKKIPFWIMFLDFQNLILNKAVSFFYNQPLFKQELFALAQKAGKDSGAKPLESLDFSLAGNPETIDAFGKAFPVSMLYYYQHYAYCSRFIDFGKIKVFVELGSGAGKQVEIIKKFFPKICFLLFDIPPQLYVCEQYLKSVFPDDVVSYAETRNMKSLPKLKKGKIFIFGNWKFPMLHKTKIDLFWNCASFQEMEPNVVANYLLLVNKQASAVYLFEKMDGKQIAKKIGEPGVLKQTRFEDYKESLSNFKVKDILPASNPLMKQQLEGCFHSFWSNAKKNSPASKK